MQECTIQEKIQQTMNNYKSNVAIEHGNNILTYSQIDIQSKKIANYLIIHGFEKETFIGVSVGSKVDFIITIIGIIRARCVFVPIDPSYPIERINSMIKKCNLKFVISDNNNHGEQFDNITNITYDDIINSNQLNDCNKNVEYAITDRIYVYFTSGTSGEPKAIVGKNESLLQFINWEAESFNIDDKSRVSQFTNVGFDAYLRDVFLPLLNGATLCIPDDKDILSNDKKIKKWIEDERINLIHCVPSLFDLILRDCNAFEFSSLKYVLLSGERIKPDHIKIWFETYKDRIKIVNLYGATETTMIRTMHVVTEADLGRERIPIGKPIKGSRVIILDDNMQPCEEGIIGEIYIRTPYGTYGYYNDLILNKQKFIQNPFSTNPADLIYKTGDLGKFLPDGTIDLIGRIDRQVKISGVRVELEEVENILRNHIALTDIVVIKKEMSNNELLLAFVIINPCNNNNDFEYIRELLNDHARKNMPLYMVPHEYIKIDSIPRKPNGKIDYALLSKVYDEADNIVVAPRNNLEVKLNSIWEKILNVNIGNINESFFKLGGNSLSMLRLVSEIHNELDIRLTIGEFFNNSTIEAQAKFIQKLLDGKLENHELINENYNIDYIYVNNHCKKTIFLFPPIYAFGFPYLQFVKECKDYNFYIFNFMLGRECNGYIEHIIKIQKEGPYIFLGYSAGGNLAYEVAKQMHAIGIEVSDIIMIDSKFNNKDIQIDDKNIKSNSEYIYNLLNEVQPLTKNKDEKLRNEIQNRVTESYVYHKNLVTEGKININIHYLKSEINDGTEYYNQWKTVINGNFFIYQGLDEHNQMLNNKKNYDIMKDILNSITENN